LVKLLYICVKIIHLEKIAQSNASAAEEIATTMGERTDLSLNDRLLLNLT
jgi:hypothetical protein